MKDHDEKDRIRVVYFGTPGYAVPALEALATDERYQVVLVVTQPDRPSGRGRTLRASDVKKKAIELGLSVYQPESLRRPEARLPLVEVAADVFVVAAYGLIFGAKTLAIPRHGCVNLHASLLPKYRGASPVTAAILSGDEQTGVSLMRVEIGLDSGPVLATRSTAIGREDTTESLTARLGLLGGELIQSQLIRHIPGDQEGESQDASKASMVRPLIKADGWIAWDESADSIERRVRAMWNWPRAWTTHSDGGVLQIHVAELDGDDVEGAPGRVTKGPHGIFVTCGRGVLRLITVQPEGKAAMPAAAWYAGRRDSAGLILGSVGAPPSPPPLVSNLDGSPLK